MKRVALVTSVVTSLLLAVLVARAGRRGDGAPPASASRAAAADWHYRHSQPTHWRSCMLKH
jgi:hypothetical protein